MGSDRAKGTDGTKTPGPAIRLRLRWHRGQWHVVKRISLKAKMLSDNTFTDPAPGGQIRGLWFEAISAKGKVVDRRRIIEPLPLSTEVFDDEGSISRVATAREEFLLDLLMPDDPRIVAVRLMASPNPYQPLQDSGAMELAVLELPKTQKESGRKGKRDTDTPK